MSPRFMRPKIVNMVKVKRETRTGLITTKTTRVTRRQRWFVVNAINRATRRDIVQFGNISMD